MYHFYIRSHSFSIMQISETGSENPFYCTMYIITCTYIHTTFFWSYSFHKNHGFYIHMLQGHPPQIGRNYYWAFFMQVVLKSWDESILVFQWTKEGVTSSWGCHVLLFLESILFTGIEHGSSMTMPRPCPSGSKKLSIRAFIWGIVGFCNSNGSFRIWTVYSLQFFCYYPKYILQTY